MAEIKKVWLVTDYVGDDPNDLFTDPAIKDEEHRLMQLCGALDEGGYDQDKLFRIVWGTGDAARFFKENPVIHDSADSARKDAEKRMAKYRKKYEAKGKKTAAERVVERFAKSGRTMHLKGKSGHTLCGETAHPDTTVESVKDADCHYCVQAWKKQHGGI